MNSKEPPSSASSLVQEITALLAKITTGDWMATDQVKGWHFPHDARCRVEARRQGSHGEVTISVAEYIYRPNAEFIAAAPRLLRLLTAEYETLQREKAEWERKFFAEIAAFAQAASKMDADRFAAEARAEAAEGEVIRSVRDHWFIQGGEMQFGAIEGNNSDEVIASILSAVRSNIT